MHADNPRPSNKAAEQPHQPTIGTNKLTRFAGVYSRRRRANEEIQMFARKQLDGLPAPSDCLPGRTEPLEISGVHHINGTSIKPPFPDGYDTVVLGMGCFWGAERLFWDVPGVYTTVVGYAGGITPNPTYEETCSGMTGHTEAVLVVFDPTVVSLEQLLKVFWENHDPTQYMGQGNDRGSQYRSGIYANSTEQLDVVNASRQRYQNNLDRMGFDEITSEIAVIGQIDDSVESSFFYAEEYHQQYLAKNPGGYCNHGFCQVGY